MCLFGHIRQRKRNYIRASNASNYHDRIIGDNMDGGGFVVSKDKVVLACENCVKYVQERRKKYYDEEIERLVKKFSRFPWNVSSLLRFGKTFITEAQAEEMIDETEFPWLQPWNCWGGASVDDAETLLSACSVAVPKNVMLSADQAEFVERWINK